MGRGRGCGQGREASRRVAESSAGRGRPFRAAWDRVTGVAGLRTRDSLPPSEPVGIRAARRHFFSQGVGAVKPWGPFCDEEARDSGAGGGGSVSRVPPGPLGARGPTRRLDRPAAPGSAFRAGSGSG